MLAPVLEGSGSRRRYPQKGTSIDRVSVVFAARVDRQIFFTNRQKRIRGGSTYAECNTNSGPLKHTTSSAMNTHHCGGREGREGGSDDAMQGESVSGGREG